VALHSDAALSLRLDLTGAQHSAGTTTSLTGWKFPIICKFIMKSTYTVSEAQANLPGLCRTGRRFVISRRDKPVYVAMPLEDYDALLETMELLGNPKAMATLRVAKAGRLAYKELNLADENFGL
jgi:PHD/YefM family antitoxin component YafN of YafNO toxin-antitoxin module